VSRLSWTLIIGGLLSAILIAISILSMATQLPVPSWFPGRGYPAGLQGDVPSYYTYTPDDRWGEWLCSHDGLYTGTGNCHIGMNNVSTQADDVRSLALIVEDMIQQHPPKESWPGVRVHFVDTPAGNYVALAFKDDAIAKEYTTVRPDAVIDGVYLYKVGDPPPDEPRYK
jgi:hypothetical protein